MRKIVLSILIVLIGFCFSSFAKSEDENFNETELNFFTGIFEFYSEIRQFRVIQNDIESIEIEYIPTAEFSNETLDKLKKDMGKYLGEEELSVSFHAVDEIPATPSGKPQIIESNLE